jgi:hypothetical protein
MVRQVRFLVSVEELPGDAKGATRSAPAREPAAAGDSGDQE